MTTVLAPEVTDVQAVVEEVWRSFLDEAEPLLPRVVPAGTPFDGAPAWSAGVSVSGGWEGTVTVEVAQDVAHELTRRLLAIDDADEVGDEDVADAVGELVNMVGGNIKSLMPGPSVLTLPSVAAGRAAFASDSVELSRLDALWRGQPVRVTVHAPSA